MKKTRKASAMLRSRYTQTISEVINGAKVGAKLTDGKRKWVVMKYGGSKIAVPTPYNKGTFELWADCGLEKLVVLPGLRVI